MIDSVKIGPITYAVSEVTDLHYTNNEGKKVQLNGHITYADSKIKVAADMGMDRKVVTLWHEACHGILENAGQDNQPEALIIALTFGLVQLVRDNPELVRLTAGDIGEQSAG